MSSRLGPSGGYGGTPFEDVIPEGSRIAEVRSGARIDAIQIIYEAADGQRFELPQRGGSGGNLHVLQLPKGVHIVEISGRVGARVDSLNIKLRSDVKADPPGLSAGGSGGDSTYCYQAPWGTKIVGFHGRSGLELDAIGVIVHLR